MVYLPSPHSMKDTIKSIHSNPNNIDILLTIGAVKPVSNSEANASCRLISVFPCDEKTLIPKKSHENINKFVIY